MRTTTTTTTTSTTNNPGSGINFNALNSSFTSQTICRMRKQRPTVIMTASYLLMLIVMWSGGSNFIVPVASFSPTGIITTSSSASRGSPGLCMNLFGDLFKDAFANDPNLSSSDKITGQLESGGPTTTTPAANGSSRQQWSAFTPNDKGRARSGGKVGAPIDPKLLIGTKWQLDLFLAGVPERDPSNDLYGNRINISNRDRTLGLGMEPPKEPTVSVMIRFTNDNACTVMEPTPFTSGEIRGQYKLSHDNRYVRFSIHVSGYTRTIQTKGTITKVFWSKGDDEVTTQTTSTYSIPPGWVYADGVLGYGLPGELVMSEGILRIEQTTGILKASSKMIPCGKFTAKMVMDEKNQNRRED